MGGPTATPPMTTRALSARPPSQRHLRRPTKPRPTKRPSRTYLTETHSQPRVRLRYRVQGDRVYVRIASHVENETRIWTMLQRFGVRFEKEGDNRSLVYKRWIPRETLPKLNRAAGMLRAKLEPEEGEAPVSGMGGGVRAQYEKMRPFDTAETLEAAKAEPDGGFGMLRSARATLASFLTSHPGFASEARADLKAIDQVLERMRLAVRRDKQDVERSKARELSEALKGVASEDLWRAHAALKQLQDSSEDYRITAREHREVELPAKIPGFTGSLRPYQSEGVRFLLERAMNTILADEMGLGKTVMTIAAALAADERVLVVAPANVLYNWSDEVERFTGEKALIYHGQKKKHSSAARFMVTTYDSLRTLHTDDVDIVDRGVLVLDEAHYVRNPKTQRARMVAALPQKRRLLLTGTPLVNSIEDYFELLRAVDPVRFASREAFKDAWLVDPGLFNRYAQVRAATANYLQRAARDVLIRRKKDDVLDDLPPRTISIQHHEMKPQDMRVYRGLESRVAENLNNPKSEVALFAAIHTLRKHIATVRVHDVGERIKELLAADESVVVYSHYLDPLHKLHDLLGAKSAVIEGATAPQKRQEIAKQLGTEHGPKVVLAQMEAGGVGLNFTGARFVIFMHFGWTPAVHAQAMDRVHRIGQDRPVLVEFFVTPGTIDDRFVKILLRKEADQNLVLADDSDVFNRDALVRLIADDAKRRVDEEKEAMGLG